MASSSIQTLVSLGATLCFTVAASAASTDQPVRLNWYDGGPFHLMLDDGRVLVDLQSCFNAGSSYSLARFDAGGALDPSYGEGGMLKLSSGRDMDRSPMLVRQSDGKLLLGFGKGYSGTTEKRPPTIRRLLPDGSVDRTFGRNGEALVPGRSIIIGFNGAEVLPDDSIVVKAFEYTDESGLVYFLAKLDRDGHLDEDFGEDGYRYFEPIQESEETYLRMNGGNAFYDGARIAYARSYNSPRDQDTTILHTEFVDAETGETDPSYGSDGVSKVVLPGVDFYYPLFLATRADGGWQVFGHSGLGNGSQLVVVTLTRDGKLVDVLTQTLSDAGDGDPLWDLSLRDVVEFQGQRLFLIDATYAAEFPQYRAKLYSAPVGDLRSLKPVVIPETQETQWSHAGNLRIVGGRLTVSYDLVLDEDAGDGAAFVATDIVAYDRDLRIDPGFGDGGRMRTKQLRVSEAPEQ